MTVEVMSEYQTKRDVVMMMAVLPSAHVQVLIGAGGGAGQVHDGEGAPMATGDDVQTPVDQRADVADNVAEEGNAVLVLV